MGLLDRWSKKTQMDQLNQNTDQADATEEVVVKKPTAAKKAADPKKEKVEKVEKTESEAKISSVADKVLVRPLVTEKAAIAASKNQYGFIVAKGANKTNIKKAVESVYGVKPVAINVSNVSGKNVRFGRSLGRRSDYKKAMVTLPQGKTINIHEGV